jgi:hypothetical protein
MRIKASLAAAGNVDSRARATCVSRTTPAQPATTHAPMVWRPIPPCAYTGRPLAAIKRCTSTNVVSSPTRPPDSWPLATRASAPASMAARASSIEVHSTRTIAPAARRLVIASARSSTGAAASTRSNVCCGGSQSSQPGLSRRRPRRPVLRSRRARIAACAAASVSPSRLRMPVAPVRNAARSTPRSGQPGKVETRNGTAMVTALRLFARIDREPRT